MKRKSSIIFSSLLLILAFILLILFAMLYINPTAAIEPGDPIMIPVYLLAFVLGFFAVMLSAIFFMYFNFSKSIPANNKKWLVFSAFSSFTLYALFTIFSILEVTSLGYGIVISNQLTANAIQYLPVIILPLLVTPAILGFANIHSRDGGSLSNRIII